MGGGLFFGVFFLAAGDISLSARAEWSAVRRTTKRMNFKEGKVRRGGASPSGTESRDGDAPDSHSPRLNPLLR